MSHFHGPIFAMERGPAFRLMKETNHVLCDHTHCWSEGWRGEEALSTLNAPALCLEQLPTLSLSSDTDHLWVCSRKQEQGTSRPRESPSVNLGKLKWSPGSCSAWHLFTKWKFSQFPETTTRTWMVFFYNDLSEETSAQMEVELINAIRRRTIN